MKLENNIINEVAKLEKEEIYQGDYKQLYIYAKSLPWNTTHHISPQSLYISTTQ